MMDVPVCGEERERTSLPSPFSSIRVLTGWGEAHPCGRRDIHFAQWYQGPLPSFMLHSNALFISAELLYPL